MAPGEPPLDLAESEQAPASAIDPINTSVRNLGGNYHLPIWAMEYRMRALVNGDVSLADYRPTSL